jgi:hypothetical protein
VHRRAFYRTCVAAATAAVALSGCGSSDPSIKAKSPTEIVNASAHAAEHYAAVRASGLVQDTGKLEVRVDMVIVPGRGAIGGITYRWGPFSAYPIGFVRLGQSIYLQVLNEKSFYERLAGGRVDSSSVGKWVQASTHSTGLIGTLTSFTELPNLTRAFLDRQGKLSKGGVSSVAGQAAVEVKNDATGEVLYVATAGRPYPMQILKSGANTVDGIVFDQWNRPAAISAPANAINVQALSAKT